MPECEHCGAEFPMDSESCPSCGQGRVPDELLGTEILGRYRLVKLIAEGGMGRVYLAEQAVGSVQRRVAVKVLRKQLGGDKQLMSRFAREAETLVRLTHPNTVQLFDFGALPDGTLALAMEYVQGISLARELQKGPLVIARAERMLAQICGALEEAHASGIVHRDLKPDNLLIADRVGQGDFVKVLDFGIAKVAEDGERRNTKLTQQGMIIGTPPYMSPEQFGGEAIDARADIYSLGVIAFEMLSGRLPFTANTPWEWASRHLTATPQSLQPDAARGLSPSHARAIERALQKAPADRPQSVQEFLALFTARDGAAAVTVPIVRELVAPSSVPVAAAERDPDPRPTPTARTGTLLRRRTPLVGPGVAVLATIGVLTWLATRESSREAPESPAALPSPPVTASAEARTANALPLGVAPPDTPAPPLPATNSSHESARHRRREQHDARKGPAESAEAPPVAAPADPAAGASGASVRGVPEPRVDTAEATRPVEAARPAQDARPSSPVPRTTTAATKAAVPADLEARIAQIQSALSSRPEVAVGLYQAATGRYGAHPSLSAMRTPLSSAVESRVRQLLASGRCAQAQAIQRALRGAIGGSPAAGLFGPKCPAP